MAADPESNVTPLRTMSAARPQLEVRMSLRPHWLGEVLECVDPQQPDELLYVVAVDPSLRTPKVELERRASDLKPFSIEGIQPPPRLVRLADRRVGLAYPYLDGVALAELSRGAPMPTQRALSVLRQSTVLIADLHDLGLHHGGLSIDSLVLSAGDGKLDTLTIADFGLAQLFPKADDHAPSAAFDSVPASPERALGLSTGPAQDVYQLGVLGFLLLTGETPFPAADAAGSLRRHAIEEPPDLALYMQDHPAAEDLARVFAKCLQKEAGDRYANAGELDRALARAIAGANLASVSSVRARPNFSAEEVELVSRVDDLSDSQVMEVAALGAVAPAVAPPPPPKRASEITAPMPAVALPAPALLQPQAVDAEPLPIRSKTPMLIVALALLLGAGALVYVTQSGAPAEAAKAPVVAKIVSEEDPVAGPAEKLAAPADSAAAQGTDPAAPPSDSADKPNPQPEAAPTLSPEEKAELAKKLVKQAKSARSSGNTSRATALYREALSHQSRNLTALSGLSALAFNKGDYAGAITYSKRAVRASPRKASLRIELGDAYFKKGQLAEAKTQYQKAKDLGSGLADKRLAKVGG